MALKPLRLGSINSLADVAKAMQDIQQFADLVYSQCPATLDVQALGIQFLIREADGTWHLWTLAAGAGVTLTANSGTRTLTVSSP